MFDLVLWSIWFVVFYDLIMSSPAKVLVKRECYQRKIYFSLRSESCCAAACAVIDVNVHMKRVAEC